MTSTCIAATSTLVHGVRGHNGSADATHCPHGRPSNTTGISNPLSSALPDRQHDHREITEALRNRDAAGARAAMERHIVGTIAVIRNESASAVS